MKCKNPKCSKQAARKQSYCSKGCAPYAKMSDVESPEEQRRLEQLRSKIAKRKKLH